MIMPLKKALSVLGSYYTNYYYLILNNIYK